MIDHKPIEISDIILLTNKTNIVKFKNYDDEEFYLESVCIEDYILKLNVSYNGGCKKHQFLLVEKKNFHRGKNIYEVHLQLLHNSNQDNCKKIVTEAVIFQSFTIKS